MSRLLIFDCFAFFFFFFQAEDGIRDLTVTGVQTCALPISTDGATNMAIDEAVWLGRRAGASPPTIRFFAWAPPTVSPGYGQPLDRHLDDPACRRLGVGLLRRPTGGGAIYHDGPPRVLPPHA